MIVSAMRKIIQRQRHRDAMLRAIATRDASRAMAMEATSVLSVTDIASVVRLSIIDAGRGKPFTIRRLANELDRYADQLERNAAQPPYRSGSRGGRASPSCPSR